MKTAIKIFLLFLITAAVVLSTVSCVTITPKNTNSEEKEAETTGQKEQKKGKYQISDTVSVGGLEFKVLEVTDQKEIGEFYTAETENIFTIVRISVKNNNKKAETIYDSAFYLYRGEYKYEATTDGLFSLGDDGFFLCKEIGPGLTETFCVVYELPSEHTADDYILFQNGFKSERVYLTGDNAENPKTDESDTAEKEETTQLVEKITYKMNEAVDVGGMEFCVTDVTDTKQLGSGYLTIDTENNYVVVTFTVKNNTTKTEMVYMDEAVRLMIGENEYEISSNSIFLDNGLSLLDEFGPGLTKTLVAAFETPAEHDENTCIKFRYNNHSELIYLK